MFQEAEHQAYLGFDDELHIGTIVLKSFESRLSEVRAQAMEEAAKMIEGVYGPIDDEQAQLIKRDRQQLAQLIRRRKGESNAK